eukprot:7011496-Pyramimonas_sp.AAC.1
MGLPLPRHRRLLNIWEVVVVDLQNAGLRPRVGAVDERGQEPAGGHGVADDGGPPAGSRATGGPL